MNNMVEIGEVFTPLGRGKVVYRLSDGTFVVEFPHGGGQIFRAEDLFHVIVKKKIDNKHRSDFQNSSK